MAFDGSAYTRQILAARRRHLAMDDRVVRELERLLRKYAREVAKAVRTTPQGGNQRIILQRIIERLTDSLERDVQRTTRYGVTIQFADIRSELDRITMEAIREEGLSVRTLYQPRPALTEAQAYLARGMVAQQFRTLSFVVRGAGAAVDDIIGEALLSSWSPEKLARKIRPYIQGREVFTPEELEDLRRVPKSRRDSVRLLQYNTRRIALTEMGNAAHEAQTQAMVDAPMVEAVRWRLSPVRGSQQDKPDECDILAKQDLYGMGPGVFPTDAVPVRPHPFDRCWLQSQTRPVGRWNDPKPTGDPRQPTTAGLETLTFNEQQRAIASATQAMRAGLDARRAA